jgi:hypothetical protein
MPSEKAFRGIVEKIVKSPVTKVTDEEFEAISRRRGASPRNNAAKRRVERVSEKSSTI